MDQESTSSRAGTILNTGGWDGKGNMKSKLQLQGVCKKFIGVKSLEGLQLRV